MTSDIVQKIRDDKRLPRINGDPERPLRLLALDMDGTLLREDHTIGPRTREWLLELQRRGVRIALVSGRPLAGLVGFVDELKLKEYGGLLIGVNGGHAMAFDEPDAKALEVKGVAGTELWRHTISKEVAVRFFERWKPFGLTLLAYGTQLIYVDPSPDETQTLLGLPRQQGYAMIEKITGQPPANQDLRAVLPEEPLKLCVAGPRPKILEGLDALKPTKSPLLSGAFSASEYYETAPAEVNKGAGLQEAARRLKIDLTETIAFGDQDNDATMLRHAGIGVAMGNASPMAKEAADDQTTSNEEEGIAAYLERHLVLPAMEKEKGEGAESPLH